MNDLAAGIGVTAPNQVQLSMPDLVRLAIHDTELFGRAFFPRAIRQKSPQFHRQLDAALDDPTQRYVSFECFRDSAKTTKLRVFTAKRIAYGLSRTILYIGASEDHATRSVRWIKRAVERNKLYAGTFGLRPGAKWTDTEIEVFHGLDERPIWLLGVGITGNVRGINFDDYRPDLIILDDVITDENAATLEQREKINNLILGAVKDSLAPASEEPNAKMANLQTPMHPDDATARMAKSREWHSYRFPCWTEESEELPVDEQISSWEERHPSSTLRGEKILALEENRYSVWAREKECKLVTQELATFRAPWLKMWREPPVGSANVLIIDPVPPPSIRQQAKGLRGKDFESHMVVGRKNGEFYALENRVSKGHQPNWTVANALELARKWHVMRICLVAVGYETVLENLLKTEMHRRLVYHAVIIIPTANKTKFARISSALAGPTSQGKVHVHPSMSMLIEQFNSYGPTYSGHDDALETLAAGVQELANPYLELAGDENASDVYEDEDFIMPRSAP